MRRLIMTGFFRDILIRHFTRQEGIEDLDLRHLLWREDERTNILIESIWRWRPQITEKRPAILIKRNSCRNVQKGIDNFVATNRTGNEEFSTFWVGSHTLFCLGETGAIAEILSTEVQRELTQFGPRIRSTLGLNKFDVTDVGPIGELEEATENCVVPVTVGWAYEETWQLVKQALPIRRINLAFLFDLDVQKERREGPIITKPAQSVPRPQAPMDPC
jgi:hypothetical protein